MDHILSPMCSVTVSFSTWSTFDNDYLLNQLFHFDQNVILLLIFVVLSYFQFILSSFLNQSSKIGKNITENFWFELAAATILC